MPRTVRECWEVAGLHVRRILTSLLVALAVLAAPTVRADDTKKPSAAALRFAGGFSDQHLEGMLQRIGARQPVMVAASRLHGELLAAVFDAEIAKAVKKYGATWKRNMAIAWSGLLGDDVLASLADGPAKSPYLPKYLENRGAAGKAMGKLSGALLRKILGEVIKGTLAALSEPARPGDKDTRGKTEPGTAANKTGSKADGKAAD